METKYLKDYVDYMHELYPFLTRESVEEMMEDSFDLLRDAMSSTKALVIKRRTSQLLEDDVSGRFLFSTIKNRNHYKKALEYQRRKQENNGRQDNEQ